jgi:2-keto-4-pentenoate hydratase
MGAPPIDSAGDASARRDPWEIPAVRAGMEGLLARRAELLEEGATPIGWKLAFGTEVAMSKLRTTGPLVGFLTDATLIAPGGECSVGGWTAPKFEPEIAIHLGAGGEGVAGISAAIELADADRPPTDVEAVLAGDIYHRAVVLDRDAAPVTLPGATAGTAAPASGRIAARIERDGTEVAATDDAEAEVGRIEVLAAWTCTYLEHFDVATAAGEIVISGAVVPLVDIAPGEHLVNRLAGVGELSVYIHT